MRQRRHRPVLMIDLAVPRDIEDEVSRLDDVVLYTVDDLREVVDAGLEGRRLAGLQPMSDNRPPSQRYIRLYVTATCERAKRLGR